MSLEPQDPRTTSPPPPVRFGIWRFEPGPGRLFRDGTEILLAPKPLGVLRCLLRRPGEVVSKEEILHEVWNGTFVTDRALSEVVRSLRETLGDDSREPRYIQTVHRRGFRFVQAVRPDPSIENSKEPAEADAERRGISPRRALPWSIFLSGGLALAAVLVALRTGPTSDPSFVGPAARFGIELPEGAPLSPTRSNRFQPLMAISPNGRRIAYVAEHQDTTKLFWRELDGLDVHPIERSEGGHNPFFSPDGEWLGFFAKQRLWKTSLAGGAPIDVAPATLSLGADWGEDGTIVFSDYGEKGLRKVAASGGAPEVLVAALEEGTVLAWPELLADGTGVLYTKIHGFPGPEFHVAAYSFDTGKEVVLIRSASNPRVLQSGHLIYASSGSIWGASFDETRFTLLDDPFLVTNDVLGPSFGTAAQYDVSVNGVLLLGVGGELRGGRGRVEVVNELGEANFLFVCDGMCGAATVSPGGDRLAYSVFSAAGSHLWIYDLEARTQTRFTYEGTLNDYPVWSPNGDFLAFPSYLQGTLQPFIKSIEGGSPAEPLLQNYSGVAYPTSWSPDGSTIAAEVVEAGGLDVGLVSIERSTVTPFVDSPAREGEAQFSPEGEWVAYSSDATGRSEIYVRSIARPREVYQISSNGGDWPRWSKDGKRLFFREARHGGSIWAVSVETRPAFKSGRPIFLFESDHWPFYDVFPDGRRFVMVRSTSEEGPTDLIVMTNVLSRVQ